MRANSDKYAGGAEIPHSAAFHSSSFFLSLFQSSFFLFYILFSISQHPHTSIFKYIYSHNLAFFSTFNATLAQTLNFFFLFFSVFNFCCCCCCFCCCCWRDDDLFSCLYYYRFFARLYKRLFL